MSVLSNHGVRRRLAAFAVAAATFAFAPVAGATVDPSGACCFPYDCHDKTETMCAEYGGFWQGGGTLCGEPGVCGVCPNGEIEAAEECDDGNTLNGDGCDDKCRITKVAACGNYEVEEAEQCDDGNTTSGDGCTDKCQDEYCGDGIVNDQPPLLGLPRTVLPGEQCDDGNTLGGDGCDEWCQVEIPTGACCSTNGCFDGVRENDCALEFTGAWQGSGTTCEDAGICSACANGVLEEGEACDDGDTATGDGCDDACAVEPCWTCAGAEPSVCTPDDGTACDDGDECTVGDACDGGSCTGNPPILPAACRWVMVGGDDQRDVQSRTRDLVLVNGDICGETTRVGESAEVVGDVVATATSGIASTIYPFAKIDGDVLTGGGSITGKPKDTILPGLAVSEVPGGSMAAQAGDPNDVLDARGGASEDPRVEECRDAIDGIDPSVALVQALPSTGSLGDLRLDNNEVRTITASNVGGLNVIDIDRITTGNKTTLVLDGGGNPDTAFVLRVQRKLYLRFQSTLELANGTRPENVLLFGAHNCKMGEEVTGGGTILCPSGKLKLEGNTIWNGALIAGRQFVIVRHRAELTHAPLTIGAP